MTHDLTNYSCEAFFKVPKNFKTISTSVVSRRASAFLSTLLGKVGVSSVDDVLTRCVKYAIVELRMTPVVIFAKNQIWLRIICDLSLISRRWCTLSSERLCHISTFDCVHTRVVQK